MLGGVYCCQPPISAVLNCVFAGSLDPKYPVVTINCTEHGGSLCDITHRFVESQSEAQCDDSGGWSWSTDMLDNLLVQLTTQEAILFV